MVLLYFSETVQMQKKEIMDTYQGRLNENHYMGHLASTKFFST